MREFCLSRVRSHAAARRSQTAPIPLLKGLRRIWSIPTIRWFACAGAVNAYALYSVNYWDASFYTRFYHLDLHRTAMLLGMLGGIGGVGGALFGGLVSHRLSLGDARWYGRLPAITSLLFVPCCIFQHFIGNVTLSLLAYPLSLFLLAAHQPPLVATPQLLIPSHLRALTSSVLAIASGMVGSVFGPLVTGMISDRLISHGMHADSLRYAIAIASLVSIPGAFLFYMGSRHLPEDIAAADAQESLRHGA